MTPWFIAVTPFTPSDGERWTSYVEWSGLAQLVELVSLDGMLCPIVLSGEIKDEYWPHIVNGDFMLHFFTDFDFFMKQVAEIEPKNVLCVFRNPVGQPEAPPSFEFLGYDLVDREGSASALTNCRGFPEAFANSELSAVGLIPEFERAAEVQRSLRELFPDERHADCHLWAIFRWKAGVSRHRAAINSGHEEQYQDQAVKLKRNRDQHSSQTQHQESALCFEPREAAQEHRADSQDGRRRV